LSNRMLRTFRPFLVRLATPPVRQVTEKVDTKKLILKLRQESQLPLGTCRAALQATNWDMDKALIHVQEEAKRTGLKKMASLASRKTTEGLVGVAQSESQAAMIVVNCESEPVSKTPEFNRLVNTIAQKMLSQSPAEYTGDEILLIGGVKDALVETIGLVKENIKIQKGIVVNAANIGTYVRSKNVDFPLNGTYGAIVGLTAGNADLSSKLATHCVLELPKETGVEPQSSLDIDNVADDEARLFYQALNGGSEVVFNVLKQEEAQLASWIRFQINA